MSILKTSLWLGVGVGLGLVAYFILPLIHISLLPIFLIGCCLGIASYFIVLALRRVKPSHKKEDDRGLPPAYPENPGEDCDLLLGLKPAGPEGSAPSVEADADAAPNVDTDLDAAPNVDPDLDAAPNVDPDLDAAPNVVQFESILSASQPDPSQAQAKEQAAEEERRRRLFEQFEKESAEQERAERAAREQARAERVARDVREQTEQLARAASIRVAMPVVVPTPPAPICVSRVFFPAVPAPVVVSPPARIIHTVRSAASTVYPPTGTQILTGMGELLTSTQSTPKPLLVQIPAGCNISQEQLLNAIKPPPPGMRVGSVRLVKRKT